MGDFGGLYQRQVTSLQAKRSSEKGKGISIAGADLGCPGMSGFSTEGTGWNYFRHKDSETDDFNLKKKKKKKRKNTFFFFLYGDSPKKRLNIRAMEHDFAHPWLKIP